MNAGAFGGEIADHVDELRLLTREGRFTARRREELDFSYRKLELEEGSVIVSGHFRLETSSTERVARQIAANLQQRRKTQPVECASAGSVFKNPRGDYAGRLIESVGLKGAVVGSAKISEQHANYIVNLGGATAKEVIALMDLAREKVRKGTGVELEPEIKVVGRKEE
jgi:UDP-N-acetylmuramate dehydrogenase